LNVGTVPVAASGTKCALKQSKRDSEPTGAPGGGDVSKTSTRGPAALRIASLPIDASLG
jgi:hypothetical protein